MGNPDFLTPSFLAGLGTNKKCKESEFKRDFWYMQDWIKVTFAMKMNDEYYADKCNFSFQPIFIASAVC